MKFEGKTAVITGAAQGIGRACAERLLADGANVVISDVNMARLTETAAEIGEADRVLAVRTDVTKTDDASYITGETIYPDGGRRVLNYTVPVKET